MSNQKQFVTKEILAAKTYNANTNGTGVDMQDTINVLGRNVKAFLDVGSQSGTTPTLDVKLQESDTQGGTYTDVTGGAFTQVTTVLGSQELHVKLTKRWVRGVITVGGTTPVYGVCLTVLGEKRQAN